MTWAASIHPMDGGVALCFHGVATPCAAGISCDDRPVQRVEITREKARELAALLLVAAEGVIPEPPLAAARYRLPP